MRAASATVVALVLVGCSSDVDLTGVYRVDSAVASAPCGSDQPVPMSPAFLKFHKDDLFGQPYFAYDACMDAAATTCTAGSVFAGFYEPIDGGWRGIASSSSSSSGQCLLSYEERTATVSGNQLVIEGSHYEDQIELAADKCTTTEAEKRGTKMTCVEHAHTRATKI